MELVVVRTEDVYPDESNPRQDFGDIEALAESFDLNPERPGEPFTPPLLVRDGGIYRIVDGERRYRALVSRKAETFTANVCGSLDEADAVAAMLATDDKLKLSELEMSRGVQRMLMLGVDPEKVDKTARTKGSARVKRAMAKVDDAAQDMTFDRLLAIDELSDDPLAVEKLSKCKESEWRYIADSIRRSRKRSEELAELRARVDELTAAGEITVFADADEAREAGYATSYEYASTVGTLEALMEREPSTPFAWGTSYDGAASLKICRPLGRADSATDPETEKRAQELSEMCERVLADADSWYAAAVAGRREAKLGAVSEMCADAFKQGVSVDYDATWASIENEGSPFYEACSFALSPADYALGWLAWAPSDELSPKQFVTILERRSSYGTDGAALAMLDFLEKLAESGWPGGREAVELMGVLEEFRDSGSEE